MAKRRLIRRRKAIVLIPLTYNDGSQVPRQVLDAIESEIYVGFDGYASEGEVEGAYRMSTGDKRVERLWRIAIVLEEAELNKLRQMVAAWGGLLGQEAMCLEITDSRIEFVSPNGT
jgi:hypothetical protein